MKTSVMIADVAGEIRTSRIEVQRVTATPAYSVSCLLLQTIVRNIAT
jgi:hypothetical protein